MRTQTAATRTAGAILCVVFFAQATGAADIAHMLLPAAQPGRLPLGAVQAFPGREFPPRAGRAARPFEPAAAVRAELAVLTAGTKSWAADAAVVLRYAVERLPSLDQARVAITAIASPLALRGALLPSRRVTMQGFDLDIAPSAQPAESVPTAASPAAPPPADRISVLRPDHSRPVPPALAAANGQRSPDTRFSGPWLGREGVRVRVSCLDAKGSTVPLEQGFVARYFSGRVLGLRMRVPPSLKGRTLALYNPGDQAAVAVEIENASSKSLRRVAVSVVPEQFNESGAKGARLGSDVMSSVVIDLRPGETRTLSGTLFLHRIPGTELMHFEQWHLLVQSSDGAGSWQRLVDEPQALIIDPPH